MLRLEWTRDPEADTSPLLVETIQKQSDPFNQMNLSATRSDATIPD